MKKIYLAGGISDTPRKEYQKKMAKKIRELGYEVYAASENDNINDKSNDPTPLDIYEADITEVLSSDKYIHTISGGGQAGTDFEAGVVSGSNEERIRYNLFINEVIQLLKEGEVNRAIEILEVNREEPIDIIAFTINERMMAPQFYKGNKEGITGIPSAGYNHLILGGIDAWGEFVGGEEDLIEALKRD